GRRGIDVIGHGAILKEADVEVGTIYEVAMGPTLVVESKFLPSYNMALNLLRVYTPEEAEALMQRSFGQFQKRLAATETDERLTNVRERLADVRRMWDDPQVSIDDVGQYFKIEDRRRAIRIELKRLRREAGAERRGRRGRRDRSAGHAGRVAQRLEIEAKGLLERQRKLKVVRSPRFGELLQKYGEIRTLQQELDKGQREVTGQMDEYPRKLRRLARILDEAGFLQKNKPTDKGLFAARVYGENTILVAEAVWLGWFEGLTPEELCGVMVMLAAEDRERRGDRQSRGPRRYPTPAIAQTARLIRSLYFRFADMERDLDEPNLRSPSHDYIDFAYRWSAAEPLDRIRLPANVDIGHAITAMKAVRSLLRQPDVADVMRIEIREPRYDLGRADYLKPDIRHSLIGKLVRAVGIDTVVHTLTRIDSFDMDPVRAHEMNVIGTLNLLAGCAGEGSPVRRFVLKSSGHVYGSRFDLPTGLREDHRLDIN